MIGTLASGMITMLMAKFILNDFPHAAGLSETCTKQPTLSNTRKLWHITPSDRVQSITAHGLLPSQSRMLGTILTGETTRGKVYLMQNPKHPIMLISGAVEMGDTKSGNYTLLAITLPPEYSLYEDPAAKVFQGLYTDRAIPPQLIRICEEIYIPPGGLSLEEQEKRELF